MATNTPVQPSTNVYSGADNLEVMQEAVNYNRYLLDTIRRHAKPGDRILDFGAGTGQFALPLHQQHFQVTALEPDASMSRRIAATGVATVTSHTELAPASFDLVYSLNVLEHIMDDVTALAQLHAVLKPNGALLIYVPAFPILYTSMDAKVGHVRRYRRETLAHAAQAAGFTIERMAYVDSLGFFAALFFKLFDRQHGNINRSALKIYDRLVFPVSVLIDYATRRWFGKNLLLVARK
jgi:SAM-dependent methyltransferase